MILPSVFTQQQHRSLFPWKKVQHSVCVCLEGGRSIMGHPTDIICLPICTLLAKPMRHNCFSEQGYGSYSASDSLQSTTQGEVSYRPLLSMILNKAKLKIYDHHSQALYKRSHHFRCYTRIKSGVSN